MPECGDMLTTPCEMTRKRHSLGGVRMLAATLTISLLFSLFPFGVDLSKNPLEFLNVEKKEARANPVIVGGAAAELLAEMAAAAGLTESQLVCTVVGSVAASTGMCLANEEGVKFGNSAAVNLGSLIDAADYPSWDTLSQSDQESWGSKYNYDAAKFNELMRGFGYADTIDGFYASGGNFDPSDDARERLQQLGRIGLNWAQGAGNAFSSLGNLITNKSSLEHWFGISPGYTFDASGIDDWPSGMPVNLVLGYSTLYAQSGKTASNQSYKEYVTIGSAPSVYWLVMWNSNSASGGQRGIFVIPFSEDYFTYSRISYSQNPGAINNSASRYTGNTPNFYYTQFSYNAYVGAEFSCNMPINGLNPGSSSVLKAISIMLREGIRESGLTPNIPEYPSGEDGGSGEGGSGIPGTTQIYYPNDKRGGINPETTWPDLKEPNPKPRPDNPYNPQNPDPDTGEPTTGTDTPEWRDETEENVLPLLDIKFDSLFPFCMLFDISKLFNKVDSMTRVESSSGVYNSLTIPFHWNGSSDDSIVLDLSWLHDLLLMVRIFNQILLAAFLLFTCIEFWRGILTG